MAFIYQLPDACGFVLDELSELPQTVALIASFSVIRMMCAERLCTGEEEWPLMFSWNR